MRGPYLLRPIQVDISVPTRLGGVYCLSKDQKSVSFVGRADANLRDEIKSHCNEYQFFWYDPALNKREGYRNQCQLFHKHADTGLENKEHPTAPANVDVKCPVCGK